MSSEPERQPVPGPPSGPRRTAGDPGERPGQAQGGAAEVARALGYEPDNPATWPGSGQSPAVRAEEGAGEATGPQRRDPVQLTDPIAMRALAHPVRMALIELLSALDTVTATQASELLGESPANCAFHLRTLAKYGFVEEAGGGRGRERPWKAANLEFSITSQQPDPQAALAADALGRFWLEQWIERARQMFGSNKYVPGWERATGWSRSTAFLTPEETRDLSRQMRELIKQYEPRRSDPLLRPAGALPVEWTVFAAPVAELAETGQEQAREAAEAHGRDVAGAQGPEAGKRPAGPGPEN